MISYIVTLPAWTTYGLTQVVWPFQPGRAEYQSVVLGTVSLQARMHCQTVIQMVQCYLHSISYNANHVFYKLEVQQKPVLEIKDYICAITGCRSWKMCAPGI